MPTASELANSFSLPQLQALERVADELLVRLSEQGARPVAEAAGAITDATARLAALQSCISLLEPTLANLGAVQPTAANMGGPGCHTCASAVNLASLRTCSVAGFL